jgi:hypothetical protein
MSELNLLGDRFSVNQPLLSHFIEFSRLLSGYKITIRCFLRLYIDHISFLKVTYIRTTAQQPPRKFSDIILK